MNVCFLINLLNSSNVTSREKTFCFDKHIYVTYILLNFDYFNHNV